MVNAEKLRLLKSVTTQIVNLEQSTIDMESVIDVVIGDTVEELLKDDPNKATPTRDDASEIMWKTNPDLAEELLEEGRQKSLHIPEPEMYQLGGLFAHQLDLSIHSVIGSKKPFVQVDVQQIDEFKRRLKAARGPQALAEYNSAVQARTEGVYQQIPGLKAHLARVPMTDVQRHSFNAGMTHTFTLIDFAKAVPLSSIKGAYIGK